MDTTELGFNIYDIRDFFDNSFVKEYEESVIRMREYFSRKLYTVVEYGFYITYGEISRL